MKLDRFPKKGEGLWIDGKLCRITDIKTIMDDKKAVLKVDVIGNYEVASIQITVEFSKATKV